MRSKLGCLGDSKVDGSVVCSIHMFDVAIASIEAEANDALPTLFVEYGFGGLQPIRNVGTAEACNVGVGTKRLVFDCVDCFEIHAPLSSSAAEWGIFGSRQGLVFSVGRTEAEDCIEAQALLPLDDIVDLMSALIEAPSVSQVFTLWHN